MFKHILLAAIIPFFIACQQSSPVAEETTKIEAPQGPTLDTLVSYMEGSFSSEAQAVVDSNYFHITLDMKRIWTGNENGAWLYVEQTAASTPGKPYRQRVYHLNQQNDSTFTSEMYKMPNPELFIGGHMNAMMFDSLATDSLTELEGCALTLVYRDGVFEGATEVGACTNSWGEATYATSEVSLHRSYMVSWDRGWNDAGEHVWGAENGGYKFDRIK